MQEKVNPLSQDECKQYIESISGVTVSDHVFCGRIAERYANRCTDDSGGPIGILDEFRNIFTVIGLFAWSDPSCRPRNPQIYIDLRNFLNFIEFARHAEKIKSSFA